MCARALLPVFRPCISEGCRQVASAARFLHLLSAAATLSTALRGASCSTRMTSSAGVWFASADDRAALMISIGVLLLLAALRFGFGLGLGALQYWYRWQLEDSNLSVNTILPFLSQNNFPPSSFPLTSRGLVLCHDITCDAEASRVAARRPPSTAQLVASWRTKPVTVETAHRRHNEAPRAPRSEPQATLNSRLYRSVHHVYVWLWLCSTIQGEDLSIVR